MEAIRDEIRSSPKGRITFARYMERALTEPGRGYYARSEIRPTREGDFLTAPELHPVFGRCVGRFLSAAWERLGAPPSFTVREYGAGRGTLREGVLRGLHDDASPLLEAIAWQGLDLPGRSEPVEAEPMVGVVLANEFLDALPVHRVAWRDGALVERYVTWQGGWFAEVDGAPSSPGLRWPLAGEGGEPAEGQRADLCPAAAAWMATVAGTLERGLVLVIDYGHPAVELYGPLRMAGTLRTYRAHRVGDDPFVAVGRQDITAHVDVTALDEAARSAGLGSAGATTQARFLAALGLGDVLAAMGRDPALEPQAYVDARAAVARLLDPRHLGAFRVLAWARGIGAGPSLPGLAVAS